MEKIYYNPRHPLGYTGNNSKTLSKQWLRSQPTYTLHKPVRTRGFPMRKYKTSFPNRQWQCDLVDMQGIKRYNRRHGYILTAIDVFSRYAWAIPLKTKAFPHVIQGFKELFKLQKPQLLQSDKGSEFLNRNIQEFFTNQKIKHFTINSVYKAALVERFHRTLRGRMYRYFTKHNTRCWIDVLPDLLHSYNNANHKSLKNNTPFQVYHDSDLASSLRQSPTPSKAKLLVGDLVRLAITKTTFSHGYTPNWTNEIYEISRIDTRDSPAMYHVKDMNGNEVQGRFYKENLQKVENTNIVEKILNTKIIKDKLHYLAKVKGQEQAVWL